MAYLYAFLTSILISLSVQGDIPYAGIEKAFSSNNASEVAGYGKEKLIMNIMGKEGVYSRSQAGLVIKDFFTKKPGGSFKFIFKSKESRDGSFAIGTYDCKGESFRVTIHFKKEGSDYRIESLTIEKN